MNIILDALTAIGFFFLNLFSVNLLSGGTFDYQANNNYSGAYSLVSVYDRHSMISLDLGSLPSSYTLQLSRSYLDDPGDDEDLYDMLLLKNNDEEMIASMSVISSGPFDEIMGILIITAPVPNTSGEDAMSVEDAMYNMLQDVTQIRYYDLNQTQLVLGGPEGSLEFSRTLV